MSITGNQTCHQGDWDFASMLCDSHRQRGACHSHNGHPQGRGEAKTNGVLNTGDLRVWLRSHSGYRCCRARENPHVCPLRLPTRERRRFADSEKSYHCARFPTDQARLDWHLRLTKEMLPFAGQVRLSCGASTRLLSRGSARSVKGTMRLTREYC